MPECTPPRWPAWLLLTAVGGAVVVAGFALLRYPANLRNPAAPVCLIAWAVILAGYLGLTGWILRHSAGGWVLGALLGLAAAAAWSVEIWAGGPANLDRPTERAIGALFALFAVALTLAAGVWAGRRSRNPRVAFQAGSFAGLISGAAVFIFAVVMTLTNLGVLASRDDYATSSRRATPRTWRTTSSATSWPPASRTSASIWSSGCSGRRSGRSQQPSRTARDPVHRSRDRYTGHRRPSPPRQPAR